MTGRPATVLSGLAGTTMSNQYEHWVVADSRTGKPLGVASYGTKAFAEMQIAGFVACDGKGGRPDIHHLIPFMIALQIEESK